MADELRAPNMIDVAARAGVSHQTVSRVLNGFEGVRPRTRERVFEAIQALGYRRNFAARTLAIGRSQAIGVLVPDVPNFGPTSSLYAVERAARNAGYQPLVTVTPEDKASVEESLNFLLDYAIEALVVMAPRRLVLEVIDGYESKVPMAYLLTGSERAPWSVCVDQGEGMRLAVRHVIDQGHTLIQHVAGPDDSTEAVLRAEGFTAEIAKAGLPELPIVRGVWSPDAGYQAAAHLDPRATAVVCANDHMAIGVIHALAEKGIRVPEDVSVVGFDDVPEAAHVVPPLTTVRQDFRRVGELAVEVLVAALAGKEAPDTSPLPPVLVVRSSVAPPPSAR